MAERELLRQIDAKVRQTRRRQVLQQALAALPAALALAFLGAWAWTLAEPWLGLASPPWLPAAVAAGVALLATAVWVRLRVPSAVNAALSLDRAFELKERMTTAISLDPSLRATPAGQALLSDAEAHLGQLKVAERFPVRVRPRPWLSPLGAGVALALAVFSPLPGGTPAQADKPKVEPVAPTIDPLKLQAIKQANEERRNRIKDIDDEKLKELQAEFDKLIAQMDKLDKPAAAQLTLQEVTKLAEQVQKRQDELAKSFDLKRKLMADEALKQNSDAPTKDLQKALAQGDMNKAKEEVDKLAQKLKDKSLSEEDKKKLAEGLKDLQKKLKDLAEQKKKLEELAKSNLDPETKQKEMEKIQQEMQNLQDLAKMAEKMQKAQQAMEKGDQEQAMKDLQELADQLKEMGLDEKMLSELELAESDLEEIKEGLG